MLEELFAIFTFLKNLAFYTILISYNTGQLLVWCIQTCVNILLVLWGSMCTLGVVAGEDLDVWLNDVSARLGTATLWLVQAGERFGSTISDGLSLLISTGQIFTVVQNVILHVFSKIFSCILNIASWVKHICVLLGWGIWFAVTFVPLTIMYICINTTYCVGRFIEELLQVTCSLFTNILIMMHNAYEFIIDVPVESTIGLFIGACFIYVLLQSYQILYILLEHVATRIWRSFKLRCQRFYRRRSSHTINCKFIIKK